MPPYEDVPAGEEVGGERAAPPTLAPEGQGGQEAGVHLHLPITTLDPQEDTNGANLSQSWILTVAELNFLVTKLLL